MTEKEKQIVDRVKLMLGGDVVKIEIPDSTILECIKISIDTISPYIPDTCYKTHAWARCIDMDTLTDSRCEEVLRVIPGSQSLAGLGYGDEFDFGAILNSYMTTTLGAWTTTETFAQRQIYSTAARSARPDQNIPFDYDRTTHKLYLGTYSDQTPVTIEYIPTVYTIDDLQDKASVKWCYLYTLALSKEIVGRIRSKAKSQNVPIQLDGDTLLAEAQREKAELEEDLISDSLGPVFELR